MSFEDTLHQLSEGTAKVVLQLWEALDLGELDPDDFPELVAMLVATANAQGAAAGQLAFRAFMEAHDASPTAIAAVAAVDDHERLLQAVGTVLSSELDTRMQLERLARNEPMQAATNAFHDAMQGEQRVSGWRRQLEAEPCQLCRWWARDGRVWQADHRMPRHTGCACHQIPVIDEATDNFQTTRQARATAAMNDRRTRKATA
ncbi:MULTISPECIES: hypothetical protein [unclassified Luteococcus]|uniref:hypothetical protein n=1 Tax=unclassified Luteococcus TaxID=2639923 RepID=UPI00313CEACE